MIKLAEYCCYFVVTGMFQVGIAQAFPVRLPVVDILAVSLMGVEAVSLIRHAERSGAAVPPLLRLLAFGVQKKAERLAKEALEETDHENRQ